MSLIFDALKIKHVASPLYLSVKYWPKWNHPQFEMCFDGDTEILSLLNLYWRTKSYSHNSGNRHSQLRHFHLMLVCINTINLMRDRGSTAQSCDYQNEENCWYCHFVVTTDRSQCSLKEDREYHLADKLFY